MEGLTIDIAERSGGMFAAWAIWDGVRVEVTSRGDVSGKLIRALVEAGLPDQPWQVFHGGRLSMSGGSTLLRAGMVAREDDGGARWEVLAPPPGQTLSPPLQRAADAYKATRAAHRVSRVGRSAADPVQQPPRARRAAGAVSGRLQMAVS